MGGDRGEDAPAALLVNPTCVVAWETRTTTPPSIGAV